MTRQPLLRPGDRVGLVAPAGPLPPGDVDRAVDVLRGWGLDVVTGTHLRAVHGYLAGADADRAADFTEVWCTPGLAAVFCARGGYGCLRMVDLLAVDRLRAAGPRLLVGSSDTTVLHELLGPELGLGTVFGPMPVTEAFLRDPPARADLRRVLFEPDPVVLHGEPGSGAAVTGPVVGGNASLLAATLGAPGHRPPPPGAIAVLEDVTESPYRLDRILTQLRRAGWFDTVAAVALGSFHDCGDPDEVRAAVTASLPALPTVWGLGFGHCPAQRTVRLHVPATLDPAAGTLSYPRAASPASTSRGTSGPIDSNPSPTVSPCEYR